MFPSKISQCWNFWTLDFSDLRLTTYKSMIGLKGSFFSTVKGHPNLAKSYLKTWNGSERSPSNSTKGFKSVFMFSNRAKKRHDGGEQSRLLESR